MVHSAKKKYLVITRERLSSPFRNHTPSRMTLRQARMVRRAFGSQYAKIVKQPLRKRRSSY